MTAIDLAGRVVILTGAAGGMGRVMALALAAAGARVAAIDNHPGRLADLSNQCAQAGHASRLFPMQVDVADRTASDAVVPRVQSECGDIFALINLAGIGPTIFREDYGRVPVRFWECDMTAWQTLMDINIRAAWILAGAATRAMLPAGRGRIVNITTSFDTMLQKNNSAYGQSKAALEAATSSWAKELDGTGITVNALAPGGPTNTGLIPPSSPMKREAMIQPEVMAKPIVWMMSDAAEGFSNRRVIASLWDEATAWDAPPAAWPGFGTQSRQPGSAIR